MFRAAVLFFGDEMNLRRNKYKRYRISGMKPYNAAIAAGYSESVARSKVYNIEKAVNESIVLALEKAGLTDKYQSEEMYKLTQANKVISADIFIRDENGKLTVNKNSNDWIEIPDNQSRINAHKHISELKGRAKGDINITTVINDRDKLTPEIEERRNRLMGLFRKQFKE